MIFMQVINDMYEIASSVAKTCQKIRHSQFADHELYSTLKFRD